MTRSEADAMALRFLRDYGAHTMGPIEDEEALSAAFVFLELHKLGWVAKTDFGEGWLQFAITDDGLRALACAERGEAA